MDIQAYKESGVLELYALGLLKGVEEAEVENIIASYPELREEINNIQLALEKYAASTAILPSLHIKKEIRKTISNLDKEQKMQLNDLPLINRFSDHNNWLRLVTDYIPEQLEGGRFIKDLSNTATLMQMLLVSSTDFEDEIHTDLHESFLILEGTCKCIVGGQVSYMEAGDYMDIPLHQTHSVEIVSPKVVAILQRISI